MKNKFYICRVKGAEDLPLPSYQTDGSAGMDLYSNVSEIIPSGEYKMIPTGIQIQIPSNFEAQVRPRSGLAYKYGVTALNSPGTIDSDYRGEIKVILINHGKNDFVIKRGDRIAQMVIGKIEKITFVQLEELEDSERGEGGFGHTGIN